MEENVQYIGNEPMGKEMEREEEVVEEETRYMKETEKGKEEGDVRGANPSHSIP